MALESFLSAVDHNRFYRLRIFDIESREETQDLYLVEGPERRTQIRATNIMVAKSWACDSLYVKIDGIDQCLLPYQTRLPWRVNVSRTVKRSLPGGSPMVFSVRGKGCPLFATNILAKTAALAGGDPEPLWLHCPGNSFIQLTATDELFEPEPMCSYVASLTESLDRASGIRLVPDYREYGAVMVPEWLRYLTVNGRRVNLRKYVDDCNVRTQKDVMWFMATPAEHEADDPILGDVIRRIKELSPRKKHEVKQVLESRLRRIKAREP